MHDTSADTVNADRWYEWLLQGRHGDDAVYAAALAPQLEEIRDHLLDNARLSAGQRIADIGSGDGLAGFGALERQTDATLTFVDISPALIEYTRRIARQRGVASRCRFIVGSAESLTTIATGSIDVVLVRAVLAYVVDRRAALAEFRRILRPGGRVSIVDPLFQDRAYAVAGLGNQLRCGDSGPATRYIELLHRCRSAQFPDSLEAIRTSSLTNYNERDLLRLCEGAGFANVHLRLHIDSVPALPMPWPVFLKSSPFAGAPSVADIFQTRFSAFDQIEFEQLFRAGIEAGTLVERNVNAYIFADSP